jgi:hypothetical protein
MRSLTSLHEKRACGPQNFQHLRQNDFCNTIAGQADLVQKLSGLPKLTPGSGNYDFFSWKVDQAKSPALGKDGG